MSRARSFRQLRERLQGAREEIAEAREMFGELGQLLQSLGLAPAPVDGDALQRAARVAPAEALHAKRDRTWREVSPGVFVAEPE